MLLPSVLLIKIGIRTNRNFRNVPGPVPCFKASKRFLPMSTAEKAALSGGIKWPRPGCREGTWELGSPTSLMEVFPLSYASASLLLMLY